MLKNLSKEELEILSYTDLTELILKEENKPLNTPTIFRKICDLLEFSDEEYSNNIGEYYTSLTTDKRFVFLESNEWDLREKNPINIVLDEDDEEDIEEEEDDEENVIEEEDDIDSIVDDDDLTDVDDDLEDLAILTEEELEEN